MEKVGRQVLPIPDRPDTGTITYDATDPDTSFPPISQVRPPEGAPNVVVVLLDDVGFGASNAFGGPCATPTFERLAGNGLKYTRFHTAAMCAPTRVALLTGRNHHSAAMGSITETATSAPGYSSARLFSADDGMDVGTDTGLKVTDDEPRGPFTGTINWVQLDLGIEDNEHLLTAEDRYRAAMMRQ